MDVVEIPVIDVYGEGCATGKLIEITERIVKEAKILYQNIWVVFDKDDFNDFDQAIKDGMDKGYKLVDTFDGVNTAIKNAKRRMSSFRNGIDRPSEYDPGTTVHELL